jgi:hypothetical protein
MAAMWAVWLHRGLPPRREWSATPRHVLGNRRLGDVDTQLQQLAMNAWRTPKGIVAADGSDQISDVSGACRPADTTTRLPAPVQAEAAAVAAQQRLRLEDDRSSEQRREQAVEPDKDQPICGAQPEPGGRRPRRDQKLLAEKCNFSFADRARSEQSDEKSAEQPQEVGHPAIRVAHRCIGASTG